MIHLQSINFDINNEAALRTLRETLCKGQHKYFFFPIYINPIQKFNFQ